MLDWREKFGEKELNAKEAISLIQPGQKIFIDSGCSEPQKLMQELINEYRNLKDIEINHFLSISHLLEKTDVRDKPEDLFRYNAFFIADDSIRDAVNEGQADYTPIFLSEIPEMFRTGRKAIDVALIQVSPPDKSGLCSFGVNVDVAKPISEAAHLVIAEINPNIPRTLGNSFIHMKKISHYVYSENPLLEIQYGEPDEVRRKIAQNVASLIRNNATIEVGLGSSTHAVLSELKEHKDLGVHTDGFFEDFIDLIDSGVITCDKKNFNQGKVIANFGLGSKKLFNFVDDNPFIEFYPSSYTNNPFNIARNDHMTTINGALSVDLMGQVNADSIGTRFYSGIGGLVDFCRGATLSKGGMPIICLPSTALNGKISRIVPMFEPGTHVSLTMGDVHYIVTEYGVAQLHGKNIRERVMALISIAHPKFRAELLEKAKKLKYVYSDQHLATHKDGSVVIYPEKYRTTYTTSDGEIIHFRPILPTDERLIQDLYYSLDEESRVFRFFQPKKYFNRQDRAVTMNIDIDYEDLMSLVGVVGEIGDEQVVALCSYQRDRGTNLGEIAFTVRKDWRNRGLTKFMLQYLIRVAKEKGLYGFQGDILWNNKKMIHIIKNSGYTIQDRTDGDEWSFVFRFNENHHHHHNGKE